MATTGPSLRAERRLAEVTTVALAARMGLSRQSLWALERAAVVSGERARQYREALAAIRDASLASEAIA